MEIIAHFLDLRPKMLAKSIRVMLEDRTFIFKNSSRLPYSMKNPFKRFISALYSSVEHALCPFPRPTLAKAFYNHPNIKYLSESIWNNRPSYISPQTFAETVTRILRGNDYDGSTPEMDVIGKKIKEADPKFDIDEQEPATICTETLLQLRQIFYGAKGDSARFRQLLEEWFNEVSERTTGWYKKQTQFYLLLLGFWVAFLFNVDTISICRVLSHNDKAREIILNSATQSPDQYAKIIAAIEKTEKKDSTMTGGINDEKSHEVSLRYLKEAYQSLSEDAKNANLAMGLGKPNKERIAAIDSLIGPYNCEADCRKGDTLKTASKAIIICGSAKYKKLKNERVQLKNNICNLKYSPLQRSGWETFAGWLITALAISLGAPFWFDLLNKLVQLRSSGKKPDEASSKPTENPSNIPSKHRVG